MESKCYQCHNTFNINEMYVVNQKDICLDCFSQDVVLDNMPKESKKRGKYKYYFKDYKPQEIIDLILDKDLDSWDLENV